MILYLPGGASLEMGPTVNIALPLACAGLVSERGGLQAILPRSHVLGLDSDENSWADYPDVMSHVREHKLVAPEGQGAAVLIHYVRAAARLARLPLRPLPLRPLP